MSSATRLRSFSSPTIRPSSSSMRFLSSSRLIGLPPPPPRPRRAGRRRPPPPPCAPFPSLAKASETSSGGRSSPPPGAASAPSGSSGAAGSSAPPGPAACRSSSMRRSSATPGRASRFRSPKCSRNRCVVPRSHGRPGSSLRPAIFTSCRSRRFRRIWSTATPRTASISARVQGWRYAMIASVSSAGLESRPARPLSSNCRSHGPHRVSVSSRKPWATSTSRTPAPADSRSRPRAARASPRIPSPAAA